MDSNISVRRFQPRYQAAVKALILHGMEEHWGWLDTTSNRDLDDIATNYAHGIFLVAVSDSMLVGTGALIPEIDGVGRVVRMSVASKARRQGIGRLMLDRICEEARCCGYHTLVVGAESWWDDAISFYKRYGFTTTARSEDGQQFTLEIV